MESFDNYVSRFQTEWREPNVTNREQGKQNGKTRPWILPKHLWEEGLWPGIRTGQPESLPAYLPQTGVQKHDGTVLPRYMLINRLFYA